MEGIGLGFSSALWLGILTSISPCPLASNIAALSFLSKTINHPAKVLVSGLSYTLGRVISYAVLGFLIIRSILSVPAAANFLQKYMNQAFGPVLIVTGLILCGVIRFPMPGFSLSENHQKRLSASGFAGSFALGLIFALVFCPFSAAIFFGSLIPLALNHPMGMAFPFVYGIGTGLPVLVFALAVAAGMSSLNRWFQGLTRLEFYMRYFTGIVFILVGMYYVGVYGLKMIP